MIAYAKGRVQQKGDTHLVLRVGDIGYRIYIGATIIGNVDVGQELELHIHEYVGENINDLYGFASLDELEFFELLINVSGIGPKSAMGILSQADVGEIKKAIIHGKTEILTKASGIGKKNAERIIVDLRNKIDVTGEGSGGLPIAEDEDAIAGLMRLGYTKKEAREALSNVDPEVKNPDEKIKNALKHLGKQ